MVPALLWGLFFYLLLVVLMKNGQTTSSRPTAYDLSGDFIFFSEEYSRLSSGSFRKYRKPVLPFLHIF